MYINLQLIDIHGEMTDMTWSCSIDCADFTLS